MSRPRGCRMSSAMPRLPRFSGRNARLSPPPTGAWVKVTRAPSPVSGSTLMTSAPWSARYMPVPGPAHICEQSTTRTPESAPDIAPQHTAVAGAGSADPPGAMTAPACRA